MLVKAWWGREVDLLFGPLSQIFRTTWDFGSAGCSGAVWEAAPPGASALDRFLEHRSSCRKMSQKHLGLACLEQFAVFRRSEILWDRYRAGTEGRVKELRGKFLSWVYTGNF